MDIDLAVLCGKVASAPEVREFESGSRYMRLLITIRSESPKSRIDVIPVTFWDPPEELLKNPPAAGERIWVTGSLQRRFWEGPDGRRSRIEVVADFVTVSDQEHAAELARELVKSSAE